MSFRVFLVVLCSLFWSSLLAQENKPPIPIKITVLHQAIDLPGFRAFKYPYKPAITLGTDYVLGQDNGRNWFISGDLGFYFHRDFRTAVFMRAGIGYQQQIRRFKLGLRATAGSALVFATEPVYAFENGEYIQARNSGQLVFMPGADISLAYELRKRANSPEVFLSYQIAIDSPFSPTAVLPHVFVGGGITFYPFQ
ncbi:MAG: hypothetical protein AAFO91_06340 [Bacteroidota bacterium]